MSTTYKRPGKMFSLAMAHVFRKPATMQYPFVKDEVVAKFRGKLKYDASKCNGCKLCMKDCPSDAIDIIKIDEGKFKAMVALDKCIYCGQCVDSCNKDALVNTTDFELAALTRKQLLVEI